MPAEGSSVARAVEALLFAAAGPLSEADLARRLPDPDPALAGVLAAAMGAASSARYGPRLGETSGAHVDDAHGVRIAQLGL